MKTIKAPYYIEAFDNSNLFGEYPVSAMVVFRNGQKSPKEYRKYHIKTVVGANDYASMKEVVYRRYLRLALENKPFPDLIVMDGGEIQVKACMETLESLKIDIPVCGLEKDDKHTFRAIVWQGREISLDKHSDLYLFLVNISQTVHDFAISFFRSQKGKGVFESQLDGIKGVGPKKKEAMLKKFTNLANIVKGSVEDFKEIGINEKLRSEIIAHLEKNNS
jgi:excinuclease ABC subunit C